jgi:5'-nucleotidase
MEAASVNIPSLAASLETPHDKHLSYDTDVDFSAAAYFTALFARALLEKVFPRDVDLLKLDVPSNATPQTPWMLTRLSRQRYFFPTKPRRSSWDEPGQVGYTEVGTIINEPTDSDVYTLRVARKVSLTPLSLDLTSRVDFRELDRALRSS